MESESKKERLTRNRVAFDIKRARNTGTNIFAFIGIPFVILAYLTEGIVSKPIYIVLMAGSIVFSVAAAILSLVKRERLKTEGFYIIEDKLIDAKAYGVQSMEVDRIREDKDSDNMLQFSRGGYWFRIPYKVYRWSEKYSMNYTDLYNRSVIGDTFYVVIEEGSNPSKPMFPLMVYNAKMFELSEKSFEKREDGWHLRPKTEK